MMLFVLLLVNILAISRAEIMSTAKLATALVTTPTPQQTATTISPVRREATPKNVTTTTAATASFVLPSENFLSSVRTTSTGSFQTSLNTKHVTKYHSNISPSSTRNLSVKTMAIPQATSTFTIDMNAPFIQELNDLDDYMVNNTNFDPVCKLSSFSMDFCGRIDYPIPKALHKAPYFQDNMAKTAVEALSILSHGATTSCEDQLKSIYCHQNFPKCNEYTETMEWSSDETQRCRQLIQQCPQKAKEIFINMKICDKLSSGKFNINECIRPMMPNKTSFCSHTNVSAWLYHSNVEISSLLQFQFSLNNRLSESCKTNLTSYMCFMGQQCFVGRHVESYLEQIRTRCETVVKSCEGEVLSGEMTRLFLDCHKYKSVA